LLDSSEKSGHELTFRELVEQWKRYRFLLIEESTKQAYEKLLPVLDYSRLTLRVEYLEPASCPDCGSLKLRTKDSFLRKIRHVLIGQRPTWLVVKAHKYRCKACGRYFNERFPGVLKRARASEPFKNEVVKLHHNGWTQKALAQELKMGSATIERWYQKYFVIKDREFTGAHCPRVIWLDEKPQQLRWARKKWMGWQGSNLRMTESKSGVLPLDYTPPRVKSEMFL
jgi:transposase-like protein